MLADLSSRPSLLADLRRATHAAHEALDRALDLQSASIDRDRYICFLRGSLRVIEPLEVGVANWLGAAEFATRSACIRDDLAALGAPPVTREANRASSPALAPALDSEARALGATYVLEGSSLGGLVLARSLDRRLALGGVALRFLRFRADGTKDHWGRVVARIEAWGARAAASDRADACAAAVATFAAYVDAFESAGAIARSS